MQALLIATGESNSPDHLPFETPRPLRTIVNRPVMLFAIELLVRQGTRDIMVSLHHHADQIELAFESGRRWGAELCYLLQKAPLGNAGAVKWAQQAVHDPLLVVPADILIDLDTEALYRRHIEQGVLATLVVHRGESTSRTVPVDSTGCVAREPRGFEETILMDFTGAALFHPSILNFIPPVTEMDILTGLVPGMLQNGQRVAVYEHNGYWNPLSTLRDYQDAQEKVLNSFEAVENEAAILFRNRPAGRMLSKGVLIGKSVSISPDAHLIAPIYIGDNSRIGSEARIGPNVVIGKNVIVDERASVQSSTILDRTYIGRMVLVENRIVDRGILLNIQTGESLAVHDEFLVGATYRTGQKECLFWLANAFIALILFLVFLPVGLWIALLLLISRHSVFEQTARIKPVCEWQLNRLRVRYHSFQLLHFARLPDQGALEWAGRWQARWELHRLPELINVIKRELSLVGIKPLSREEHQHLNEPWHQVFKQQMPGFTGLWFTQLGREASQEEIWVADAYYSATRNWRKDLKILMDTPGAWIRRAGRANLPVSVHTESENI